MVEAVIFEIEGVLIDTEPAWRDALSGALASVGLAASDQAFAESEWLPLRERVTHLLKGSAADETTHDLVVLDALRRFSVASRRGLSMRPGARELLEEARAVTRIASVTRLRRADAEAMLALAGVAELVEFVIAADDAPTGARSSAHRRALSRLSRRAPVDGERVLALESSPSGASAANDAGIACLLVGASHVGSTEGAIVVPVLSGHDLGSLWQLAAPRGAEAR